MPNVRGQLFQINLEKYNVFRHLVMKGNREWVKKRAVVKQLFYTEYGIQDSGVSSIFCTETAFCSSPFFEFDNSAGF